MAKSERVNTFMLSQASLRVYIDKHLRQFCLLTCLQHTRAKFQTLSSHAQAVLTCKPCPQATLTDGRQLVSGCLNTTTGRPCSPNDQGTGDFMDSFALQPGERFTALWLWSGPSGAGVPNYRAGAIRLSTSLVRSPPRVTAQSACRTCCAAAS